MDFNEDIRKPWIKEFFETHNRGSNTIDGIYVSPELLPSITSGYLAFDTVLPSDHHALWIDVPGIILGFEEEPQLRRSSARCLQCRDPRVVEKYVQHLLQTLEETNSFQRLDTLRSVIQKTRMTCAQQQEYKDLDQTVTTAQLLAEKQCRKFKMGQVPWTPDLTRKIYRILYWKGVISRVLGRRIGTSVLHSRAHKAGLQHSLAVIHLPMETLKNNVAKAI